jgi:ribosomal protein L32
MAVPKKKKSASAGKRQERQYQLVQRKKLLGMADRELRHEKNRAIIAEETVAVNNENITVVAA